MEHIRIITPVKDSIDSTMETAKAVMASTLDVPFSYTIYNDFSTAENTQRLEQEAATVGYTLQNLSELTDTPSPNYLLVLRRERLRCIEENCALVIVESDVTVRPETMQGLVNGMRTLDTPGMVCSATVNEQGEINYPYEFAKKLKKQENATRHHCSFCCSLLTPELLRRVDFEQLDSTKNWFDVTISHLALQSGLCNYVCTNLPVLHRPHGSRPWKQLKYTNPIKYYWLKFTKGLDKI